MKYFQITFVAMIATMMLFCSCSAENLLATAVVDNSTKIQSTSSDWVDVTVALPNKGRGWDVAKYSVTASKDGEDDVTEQTTTSSLTMRLKLGDWSFVAKAYDSDNNLIFLSDTKTVTIAETNNAISMLLGQQSASAKVTLSSPAAAVQTVFTKVVVVATPSVSGFEPVTAIGYSLSSTPILTGLLANVDYSMQTTVYGFDDVMYAQSTTKTINVTDIASINTVTSGSLTQKRVTPPSFSEISGSSFSTSTKITLSCATSSATYYYTLDGSNPTTSSTKYSGTTGIVVDSSWASGKTVKVIATASGKTESVVVSATYSYGAKKATTPSFSKAGGTYSSDITVALTNNETSGTLKYSINGGSTWNTYSSPISVSGNGTTKTIIAKVISVTDKDDSPELSQTYTIEYGKLGQPTIAPVAGNYFTTQTFTLSAPDDGVTIYYTTDGSDPTSSSTKKKYTDPFSLSAKSTAYTIKAVATKTGMTSSDVANFGSYKIISDSSVNLTTVQNLIQDTSVWVTNGKVNLKSGDNYFYATGLTASKTYEFKWLGTDLTNKVSVYKNDLNTVVTATKGTGKYTFSTSGMSTTTKVYIKITLTSAANGVLLGLGQSNAVKPVTAVSINETPQSNMRVGSTQTFTCSFTPSDANMGTNVNWTVGTSSVLGISGSTITVKKTGSSTVVVTADYTGGVSDSKTVTIGSSSALTLTVPDWIWGDSAVIKAWAWSATVAGAWYACTGSGTTVSCTVPIDCTKVLLVRCVAGTTTPDWSIVSGNATGRIYNQTEDIELTSELTYETSWKEYGSKDTMIATTYNTYSGQDIFFGYRIKNGSGTEIQEWITVAGTYTGDGDGYNWYAIIPGIEGAATIEWKAFMRQNGNDTWMSGNDRVTEIGTNQVSAW